MVRPWAFALLALHAGVLFTVSCDSPGNTIHPVVNTNDGLAALAMRSAPVILVARITDVQLTGDMRRAGKPMAPAIPLHLARINADVLLTVRGQVRTTIEFYSWIWASGKHGGPRLFRPSPDAIRVIFLRDNGGYLHTVGDYPAYDLELRSDWLPSLLTAWNSGEQSSAEPLQRLVALRLRAEFESVSENQLREGVGKDGSGMNTNWGHGAFELFGLTGPLFVVTQIDNICQNSKHPPARFAACYVTGQYFPGRCEAFRIARRATADGFGGDLLARFFGSCQAQTHNLIAELRSGEALHWGFYGSSQDSEQRRETLRVYASAMDASIRRIACEVAAATPEARDIPECADGDG